MTLPRLLVIMGSGETSPTMVKTHRELFERLGPAPVPAVLLDTPVGFQANADEIAERAVAYFRDSVGVTIEVASMRRAADADAVAMAAFVGAVRSASYVFAGPGSPSYALRQWAGTPVPDALTEKVTTGGCVVFASAAALTLGAVTVPVYEIYKVGEEPRWLSGLDVLAAAGLRAAVIPHFDNAEGGTHDTRFCYLGEPRLARLEADLPDDVFVLGVDEHTACILDLDAATATVVGRGGVTIRRHGAGHVVSSGTTVPIDELRRLGAGMGSSRLAPTMTPTPTPGGTPAAAQRAATPGAPDAIGVPGASPFMEGVRDLERRFEDAVAASDVRSAVGAVLDLDTLVLEWSRDTTQSDEPDRARAALRAMVVRLGELAETGARDPREVVGPLVEALLDVRSEARAAGDWAAADAARDRLLAAGVAVRDTPNGTEWDLEAG